VLIGFPLGHALIQRIGVETFRRICMSFDAYIVAFGLSRTLESVGVPAVAAYQVMIAASILDTALLWLFFRRRQPEPPLVDPTGGFGPRLASLDRPTATPATAGSAGSA